MQLYNQSHFVKLQIDIFFFNTIFFQTNKNLARFFHFLVFEKSLNFFFYFCSHHPILSQTMCSATLQRIVQVYK